MAKEIVISERDNIAAIFENGKIVEFFMNEGEQLVGDIILGKVESTIPSIDAAFVSIGKNRNGFIHVSDLAVKGPKRKTGIKNYVQPKQNLLVQIAKEATGSKGPRLTCMLTIPGKYLVLTPFERKIGLSKKIADTFERDRLLSISKSICQSGYGIIVRTEAQGQSEEALKEDLDHLLKRWNEILTMSEKSTAPAVLYRDQDLLYKVLRDAITPDVEKILVDTPDTRARAAELLQSWSNNAFRLVQVNKTNIPLAIQYDLFTELERALQPKAPLPSGGYLIIEKTEALTVIDVNSGGTKDTTSLNETILKTNKEAAVEIARQIRLRDIGGVIIIDFIDMFDQREQQIVWQILANAVKGDKSQPQLSYFSEFSLLEITRHRQKKSLTELLTTHCPYCAGVGRIRNSIYRADMLNTESIRRRIPNPESIVVRESSQKSKMDDLTMNVEYLEKNVAPPQYEKYKKDLQTSEFSYHRNDNNEFNSYDSDENYSNKTKHQKKDRTIVETEPLDIVEETPIIEDALVIATPASEIIDDVEIPTEDITITSEDVVEAEPLNPEKGEIPPESDDYLLSILSPDEMKYIHSIEGGFNRRDNKFRKDKRDFNNKRRNDRSDRPSYFQKTEQPSFKTEIETQPSVSNELTQDTSENEANNDFLPEIPVHVDIPAIISEPETIEVVAPVVEEIASIELKTESIPVEETPVIESVSIEVVPEKVEEPKKRGRGRKPSKKVVEAPPIVEEVKVETSEQQILPLVIEEVASETEELEVSEDPAPTTTAKKKTKLRRIRSFAPKKKK